MKFWIATCTVSVEPFPFGSFWRQTGARQGHPYPPVKSKYLNGISSDMLCFFLNLDMLGIWIFYAMWAIKNLNNHNGLLLLGKCTETPHTLHGMHFMVKFLWFFWLRFHRDNQSSETISDLQGVYCTIYLYIYIYILYHYVYNNGIPQ